MSNPPTVPACLSHGSDKSTEATVGECFQRALWLQVLDLTEPSQRPLVNRIAGFIILSGLIVGGALQISGIVLVTSRSGEFVMDIFAIMTLLAWIAWTMTMLLMVNAPDDKGRCLGCVFVGQLGKVVVGCLLLTDSLLVFTTMQASWSRMSYHMFTYAGIVYTIVSVVGFLIHIENGSENLLDGVRVGPDARFLSQLPWLRKLPAGSFTVKRQVTKPLMDMQTPEQV